jgi:uncharacterized protein YoaH (UPF0181 family)
MRVIDGTDMHPSAAKEDKMPWTADYFPVSMRHLEPVVREKAIEIANALLAEGMEEGKAIRIAIAKAKEWAAHRGLYARVSE